MRASLQLLVVDDDEAMRTVLRKRLSAAGHSVVTAADGGEAVRLAQETTPGAIVSDVMLPDTSGVELLAAFRKVVPDAPVILITAHATVDLAVEAMKEGAHDFLAKPIDFERLEDLLTALSREEGEPSSHGAPEKRASRSGDAGLGPILGHSAEMQAVFGMIRDFAAVDAAVLVTGESGTGKELVARTLHDLGPRNSGPFVPINSAAIPRELMESEIFGHEKGAFTGATGVRQGCFELAHEGTLFLDEVAEMPVELQPKLLRVLEDGVVRRLGGEKEFRFDVRLVAATNREPAAAIQDGLLRKDLYYRLNVFSIEMPPLRKRGEDLELLVAHFVDQFSDRHRVTIDGVSAAAMQLLSDYRWPGNVRELRNACERATVLAADGEIEPRHLPPQILDPAADGEPIVLEAGLKIADAERELILRTLEETGGNKAEAARRLGIDVKTVRNKLKSYDVDVP